jgi:deferrochelatase/peroxidase EfeB
MADGEAAPEESYSAASRLASSVQAHLGKASRFADGKVRDWTFFFFFRIVPESETQADLGRLATVLKARTDAEAIAALKQFVAALANPAAINAGSVEQTKAADEKAGDPSKLFLDWLTVLTLLDSAESASTLHDECLKAGFPDGIFGQALEDAAVGHLFNRLSSDSLRGSAGGVLSILGSGEAVSKEDVSIKDLVTMAVRAAISTLSNPASFNAFFSRLGPTPAAAGNKAFSLGLLGAVLYELLRQFAPTKEMRAQGAGDSAVLRSEAAELDLVRNSALVEKKWDPVPINFAFTYSGLQALNIDQVTLASFPDVFKEGMAARADRLGDTGPSAPEHWEGVLGLDCVHGYFTGGYLASGDGLPVLEDWRRRLREEIRHYNDRLGAFGQLLRTILKGFTIPLGLEILHIELGEDPYETKDGKAQRLPYRKEHFGFRDAISQPFVNMGLGDPPPGGGTPSRDRTWTPVAPGEIYLSCRDEDGNKHRFPDNSLLRNGSTFLVFRKLEQDVAKFRIFLAKQRPRDLPAQDRLAAEFVGRWRNGTSLVQAPDAPLDLGCDPDNLINNFLYAADDPMGHNCPLSAHVRRANPRDIGGNNDVRRHRILRRSISYGGALLPPDQLGGGTKRGLLFIAANSRIDLQFELIESVWLNKGEILGQAGLNRCPVTGANNGGLADAFLGAGAVAPVTGLPRFVITRGGDYFFAPGIKAIQALAKGETFKPDEPVPFDGFSMGDTTTPELLSDARMKELAGRILVGGESVVRVAMPPSRVSSDPGSSPVAFVARVADIKQVLANGPPTSNVVFSIAPYQSEIRNISGGDMIVGTESGTNSDSSRERDLMLKILETAWARLSTTTEPVYARLAKLTKRNIEMTLRRTGPSARIDIVHDLGAVTAYNVVSELIGTPCPNYLTELAMALPFGRQHVGQVEPDWLQAARGGKPDDPGLTNWQIWSILMFVDIVANYLQQADLKALGLQAGREFITNIDLQIAQARGDAAVAGTAFDGSKNLLAALIAVEPSFVPAILTDTKYYAIIRMLLLEMTSSAIVIPVTLGSIVDTALRHGMDLTWLVQLLDCVTGRSESAFDEAIERLVYETWRINPSVKFLMRLCMQDTAVGSGTIRKGDRVAAFIYAASMDDVAFPSPAVFSLDPILTGPPRAKSNYLLFGVPDKTCWGRDHLALYLLKECLKAAARLQGLKNVAGPTGVLQKFAQVNIGLRARFVSVLPDWPKKPAP